MDNNYFVLSNKKIEIEKFHICTWESLNRPSHIEFGVEIKKDSYDEAVRNNRAGELAITLYLSIPYIQEGQNVDDLYNKFIDDNNSRFIFNDVVENHTNLDGDNRNGVTLKFKEKGELTILPCNPASKNGHITIGLKKTPDLPEDQKTGNYYFRILIRANGIIAEKNNNGLNRSNYIYDFKINKTRNLPNDIFELKTINRLDFCKINNLFCFHIIPDTFELSFIQSKWLQSVRKLELEAFSNYLPEIKQAKTGHNNIIFLKNENGHDGYSFFTVCTDDSFGIRQMAWAVSANIFVSILFASATFRTNLTSDKSWIEQIPTEYWVALGTLVILIIFVIWGKRILSCKNRFFSWIKKIIKER